VGWQWDAGVQNSISLKKIKKRRKKKQKKKKELLINNSTNQLY
jgi:hypothetical protein